MIRRITSIFCALGLFLLSVGMPAAKGEAIHFNTDTGVMLIDGTPSSTFFGVPMQTSVVDGKMQFRILGDLDFFSSDSVSAAGSRPLSLWAGDNVTVASGAVLNFDAVSGQPGKLGGGSGGGSVSGGDGGLGGDGINGGAGGRGGNGGRGGANGKKGESSDYGRPGTSGSAGQQGLAGFNNATGVQAEGAGGTGGQGIGIIIYHGAGGLGGVAGDSTLFGNADDGDPGGNGGPGLNGEYQGNPGPGGDGGDGLGALNNITGLLLSGGAGGSSGGSGGGGGGGASGTSGGGGGGGGSGGEGVFGTPGSGGNGGAGGASGRGGNGSAGAAGGVGGAGGGAVEIVAQGRINFAGRISASGADGSQRNYAGYAQNGSPGGAGDAGQEGESGSSQCGDGGGGGAGGAGGRGGNGGRGGASGFGGGGAGGTVLFKSTLFSAAGGTITAYGGISYNFQVEGFGGDGRYLTAENGYYAPDYGTAQGARREDFYNQGSSGRNPFMEDTTTSTANVIGLAGGADVYGLKEGVSAADSYFDAVRAGAPAGAVAAIMRRTFGPTDGEAYYLRDLLMIVNLTNGSLANPMLGVGAAGNSFFPTPLLQQGFARNPAFGGAGPVILSQLPARSVYATLVDYSAFDNLAVKASVSGAAIQGIHMNSGDVAYLTLAPLAGDYNNDGKVDAADYVVWRKNPGGFPADAYATWRSHFGQPPGSGAGAIESAAVPEPAALLQMAFLSALASALRRRNTLSGPKLMDA